MALINCKECGKEISDTAKICIHCGARTEMAKKISLNRRDTIIAISVAIIMIAIAILSVYYFKIGNPSYRYIKEAIKILEDYKDNKITDEKARNELKSLSYKAKKENEEKKDDMSLYLIWTTLNQIYANMGLKQLDKLDIEGYIKELKEIKT